MIIRPATKDDIVAFSGYTINPTTKAWVGEIDGEIVGVAGFIFEKGFWYGFCDIKDDRVREFPMTVVRASLRGMEEMKARGTKLIYARVDMNEKNALKWVTMLGFKPAGALYKWRA